MKILCVSDFVVPDLQREGAKGSLPPIELVISCGDLPPEYLTLLYTTFDVPVLYVKGNHDIRYDAKPPVGCTDINRRIFTVNGFRVLGLEGSRWYNGGPNQYTEAQMKRIIWKLRPTIWWRKGIDIVVSHAPPRHVHDAEDRCHRGFKSFRWLIEHYTPSYFLHGHLHKTFSDPADRVSHFGSTQVINTCGYHLLEAGHG